MQNASLWRALLCVESTVVEDVEFDEEAQVLVAHVRPRRQSQSTEGERADRGPRGMTVVRGGAAGGAWIWEPFRCCWSRCAAGELSGPRADGAAVPWARHGAGHTRAFDQQVAWLATPCSKRAVSELMRIARRTRGDRGPGMGRHRRRGRRVRGPAAGRDR